MYQRNECILNAKARTDFRILSNKKDGGKCQSPRPVEREEYLFSLTEELRSE